MGNAQCDSPALGNCCGSAAIPVEGKLTALTHAQLLGYRGRRRGSSDDDQIASADIKRKPLGTGQKRYTRRLPDASAEAHHQEQLIMAARAGDYTRTVDAIADGCDIHGTTLRGQTPLMLAASSRGKAAVDTVRFLLDTMADVEAKDEAGWTAVLHGCRNNQTQCVEVLIERKASIKARANDGKTAIMLATLESADQLAMTLVNLKAPLDKKDDRGWTALFYACEDGRADLVHWLLKKQASAKDRAKDGYTALMLAAQCGSKKTGIRLLKMQANPNAKDQTGHTALMIGLKYQRDEFSNMILEEPIDVLATNIENEDAIEIADYSGMAIIKGKLMVKARVAQEELARDK